MKFYLFYLKYDRSLYAYTSVKKYAEQFLNQRNQKCFKMKTIKLTGEQEKIFIYTNKLLQLNNYPYQTGNGPNDYVEIMATAKEDNAVSARIEEMEKTLEDIDRIFGKFPIKEKYLDIIRRLTHIYDNNGNILLDAFSLFIDMNEITFIERKPIDTHEISVWDSQYDNVILYTF